MSSLRIIHIKFLNNSRCILYHLGIIGCSCLSKRLNDRSDHHLFKFFSAFLVNAQVTN